MVDGNKTLAEKLLKVGERVAIPCPDGIKGCAVLHFRIEPHPTCKEAADRIEAQAAEIERLEKKISELLIAGNGLNGYAGHDDNCSRNNILPVCEPCTCGFFDIRKAWEDLTNE